MEKILRTYVGGWETPGFFGPGLDYLWEKDPKIKNNHFILNFTEIDDRGSFEGYTQEQVEGRGMFLGNISKGIFMAKKSYNDKAKKNGMHNKLLAYDGVVKQVENISSGLSVELISGIITCDSSERPEDRFTPRPFVMVRDLLVTADESPPARPHEVNPLNP